MGAQEILELLEEFPDLWFDAKLINRVNGTSSNSSCLNSLRRAGQVDYKNINNKFLYRHKRRLY